MSKLSIAALIVLSLCRVARAQTPQPWQQTFKVGAGCALLVNNASGTIKVAGGAGDQIEAKALKRSSNADIAVRAVGNRVELRAERADRNRNNNTEVEFDVKVPSACSTEVSSASGNITVVNVKGELRVADVSGTVLLDSTPRLVSATTVSGDIRITNGGSETSLYMNTVSGTVTARGLAARSFDWKSVSGDMRITEWSGERANAHTLSGTLELAGSLAKGGQYEFESFSGNVRLSLTDQPGFVLDSKTFSGNVRVDFAARTQNLTNSGPRSRLLQSTYGDGSASVHITTFSGNVTIARR